jgi:hypothetical protein
MSGIVRRGIEPGCTSWSRRRSTPYSGIVYVRRCWPAKATKRWRSPRGLGAPGGSCRLGPMPTVMGAWRPYGQANRPAARPSSRGRRSRRSGRGFLRAMQRAVESGNLKARNPEAFQRWLTWAKLYANPIDPTVQGPMGVAFKRQCLASCRVTFKHSKRPVASSRCRNALPHPRAARCHYASCSL